MSSYMKGYRSRNRRRRASYSKKNHYRKNSGIRETGNPFLTVKILGIGVLVIVAAFIVIRFWLLSPSEGSKETPASVVTGNSIEARESAKPAEKTAAAATTTAAATAQTEVSGKISEKVAAVSTLSPKAIATPVPTPRSKAVALTFDDGPSTINTPKILATLKKYNAHATFFVVGTRVSAGANILKQELAQGCEIGNHSWDHAKLSRLKIKGVNKECKKTEKLVRKLTGYKIPFLRPPYGAISNTMRKKLKQPMVLWSVDTLDWKSRNAKAVFNMVKKNVSDGDIILMHDIHPSTAEAIKKVIPWLNDQGYDVLTVSELMKRKGIAMKNGKAYGSGK